MTASMLGARKTFRLIDIVFALFIILVAGEEGPESPVESGSGDRSVRREVVGDASPDCGKDHVGEEWGGLEVEFGFVIAARLTSVVENVSCFNSVQNSSNS